jgi:hypothetical protein
MGVHYLQTSFLQIPLDTDANNWIQERRCRSILQHLFVLLVINLMRNHLSRIDAVIRFGRIYYLLQLFILTVDSEKFVFPIDVIEGFRTFLLQTTNMLPLVTGLDLLIHLKIIYFHFLLLVLQLPIFISIGYMSMV